MRAGINRSGILSIRAETEIEAYALSKWSNEVMTIRNEKGYDVSYIDGSKILISALLDGDENA